MYKKEYFLILLLLGAFSACKKEKVSDTPVTPSVNSADSNYLSKIYFLNGPTTDTVTTYLDYDNLKRLSFVTETRTVTLNGVTTKKLDTSKYIYNNTELLPFKIIKVSEESGQVYSVSQFLFYSDQNLLIKDSIITSVYSGTTTMTNAKEMRLFSYSGNKIYAYSKMDIGNTNYLRYDTLTLDANENIIERKTGPNPNNTNGITRYTYGSHPSPFVKLNIWKKLAVLYTEGEFYLMQGIANNLTSFKTEYPPNGGSTVTIVLDTNSFYTFKSNGYPEKLNIASSNRAIIYIYKAL